MKAAFHSPTSLEHSKCLLNWAQDFLTSENPEVRRPHGGNVVCPFVQPAMDNDSLWLVFHPEVNEFTPVEYIEDLIKDYIEPFKNKGPFGVGAQLKKALLVVFSHLPAEHAGILDAVHRNVKHTVVNAGLMAGQFHPKCQGRGVYNENFRAFQAPLPLIALRHMAIHDILFLGEDEQWFKMYDVQFGNRFNEPDQIEDHNQHLLAYYAKAKRRFRK